ncbi:hypothetical protein BN946_scf184994.g9 [Trametes cinnabarina]|uniref:F-box domain-containing protein n=1 Tax=Pycnoporus cinnabarinus TaxID=5643 RepID=A0A060SEX0_PYCCI|nr:hypothetical protein BN946_scf184994.g9 [Trametes cinnabarina]
MAHASLSVMPELPPEIIDRITDYLHDDHETLAACALAARIMHPASRYHRFNTLALNLRRIPRLIQLLDSAPDLAPCISSLWLDVKFSSGIDFIGALEVLSRLPSLQSFTVSCHGVLGKALKDALRKIATMKPHLTALSLIGPVYLSSSELLLAVSRFRSLEELSVDRLRTDYFGSDLLFSPSPPDANVGLRSLQFYINEPQDVQRFEELSALWSKKLKNLEVVFTPSGGMDATMAEVEFALPEYVCLEGCTLRFVSEEMCVAQNQSLAWIPKILSQLSSPHLRKVTLALVVDTMEDLRSIMSENAVRDLGPAYFDDMRVLDWAAIERCLTDETLASLHKFLVEGRGDPALLEAHIRDTCLELYARSLVSPVNVEKKAMTRW